MEGLPGVLATSEKRIYEERHSFFLGRFERSSILLIINWKLRDSCVFLLPLPPPFPLSFSPKWSKPLFRCFKLWELHFPAEQTQRQRVTGHPVKRSLKRKQGGQLRPKPGDGVPATVASSFQTPSPILWPLFLWWNTMIKGTSREVSVFWVMWTIEERETQQEVFRLRNHSRGTSLWGTELQKSYRKAPLLIVTQNF